MAVDLVTDYSFKLPSLRIDSKDFIDNKTARLKDCSTTGTELIMY